MIYPGIHSTANVETIFVDGYQVNICEVAPSHYEYLLPNGAWAKPGGRYFLEVEGFIVNYNYAARYHMKTGECRWDFFCVAKSDVKSWVNDLEKMLSDIEAWKNKMAKMPYAKSMVLPKIESTAKRLRERFGIDIKP